MTAISRTVDDKGRLTLGKSFANQLVIVTEVADGLLRITRAKAVPDPELWLHMNPEAIKMVMEGLEQAKSGQLVDGPDMDAMIETATRMGAYAAYHLRWTRRGLAEFDRIKREADKAHESRKRSGKTKASKQEGLFGQVARCINHLANDPRHPSLNTHEYQSLEHPYDHNGKVFCAYVQNNTPGAYRVFWCYGPERNQITIIAVTPHP